MRHHLLSRHILACTMLVLCACNTDIAPTTSSVAEEVEGPQRSPEPLSLPTPMNLNAQISFARKDLAAKLGTPIAKIKLSSAKIVTWRSSALGCPDPAKMYTEALVSGSAIYLQAEGGTVHAYHAKFAAKPFYCPRGHVESPVLDPASDPT